MSQVKNKNKFTLAGYSVCAAAVVLRWFQIRHFVSKPERKTVSCPLITAAYL